MRRPGGRAGHTRSKQGETAMGAMGGISNLKALRGSSSSFAQEESYLTFKTSPPSPKEKPGSSKPRASSPSGVQAELCVWGGERDTQGGSGPMPALLWGVYSVNWHIRCLHHNATIREPNERQDSGQSQQVKHRNMQTCKQTEKAQGKDRFLPLTAPSVKLLFFFTFSPICG